VANLVAEYRRRFDVDVARCFGHTQELLLLRCNGCDLEAFEPPITGDARFYRDMSAWWDTRMPGHDDIAHKPTYRRAMQHMKSGDKVLEVGGGTLVIPRHLKAVSYVGLELDPHSVEAAQRQGFDVRPERVEEHARSNQAHYDVVCSFQVIEHIAAPRDFVEACIACLRPGGLMIIACPNNQGFLSLMPDNILNMPPHHVTLLNRRTLEWIAEHWRLQIKNIVEEPLEHSDRRAFARLIWLYALGRFWRSSGRFALEGRGFRTASRISSAMARLTAPLLGSVAAAIPGHTIMAIYQKPVETGK
jgi:2-polyprenyl-3-methyl-5-hydroxy-6-metoxy-1,4-benzoquinol methylase